MHEHEPDPGQARSLTGETGPNLHDSEAYPVISRCTECGRYVRAEVIGAPWVTSQQYAGIPEVFARAKPLGGGATRTIPRSQSTSGM